MKMTNEILSYIEKLIPKPKCELKYSKDYELLIAVMLSAQTTDKRVNIVTKELFKKYDWYSLLSAINSTDDVDRKVVFFLDIIAEQIFENWQNKSYSDAIYTRSRLFSIATDWNRALADKWNEDPYCEEDLTDCSSGGKFLKAVDDKLVIPSGKMLLIKKREDESTLRI